MLVIQLQSVDHSVQVVFSSSAPRFGVKLLQDNHSGLSRFPEKNVADFFDFKERSSGEIADKFLFKFLEF